MKKFFVPLLALAILAGNALALPRLLALAQALPQGVVLTQQPASADRGAPLPTPPEGFGQPYALAFSRPLTPEEQQLWDDLAREIRSDENLFYGEPHAHVCYTPRARALALAHRKDSPAHPVGDGAPGTILLDLGSATICLPDEPLTRGVALSFLRQVEKRGEYESYLDQYYDNIYSDYYWLNAERGPYYGMSRGLIEPEWQRLSLMKTEYLLRGLRPSTQLATAQPMEDGLWYDQATNTIHLPARYEMTDEETLVYIELTDSLARQQVIKTLPGMITADKAQAIAQDYAAQLFGAQGAHYCLFTELGSTDDNRPTWYVRMGPEDMLIREIAGDYGYEGYELSIDAADGRLISASRSHHNAPASDLGMAQVERELFELAAQTVKRLFPSQGQVQSVEMGAYNWTDEGHIMYYEFTAVVHMLGGIDHELTFTAGDYALVYYRYWPQGCQNMG